MRSDTPKVVDADALYLLAKYGGGVGANTVLTPASGREMTRLCAARFGGRFWMRRWSWRSNLPPMGERHAAAQGRDDG